MNLGRIWDEDYCDDGNTKFIDNINYLPMLLIDLPKAFGLKNISDKSSFPYLFNTRKNQSYISPIPNSRYYSPDQMKSKERVRFTKWHEEMIHANFIFNFQHEIVNCRNDVEILRRACMMFKKIFLEHGNIHVQSVRGMYNYRFLMHEMHFSQKLFARKRNRNHSFGYRNADKQSRKVLKWLV